MLIHVCIISCHLKIAQRSGEGFINPYWFLKLLTFFNSGSVWKVKWFATHDHNIFIDAVDDRSPPLIFVVSGFVYVSSRPNCLVKVNISCDCFTVTSILINFWAIFLENFAWSLKLKILPCKVESRKPLHYYNFRFPNFLFIFYLFFYFFWGGALIQTYY